MVKITVPKSGRIKTPKLDHGQLTEIGEVMVAEQKERWAQGLDASGARAPKLSRGYMFRKARIRRTNRPIRDMELTGLTKDNFKLRKAIGGVIRAENSSREGRKRARQAQKAAEMIGFAGSDQVAVFKAAQKQYGRYAKTAWVPVIGKSGF